MHKFLKLKKVTHISLFCGFLLLLQGCSVQKFIPEDELLYTGANVEMTDSEGIEDVKEVKQSVEQVLRPDPNAKWLGMRIPLYFYYKAQQENPGFINKFLNNKIGEEPVYASEVELQQIEEIILNRLENQGYFYSQVSSTMVEEEEEKHAHANYTIDLMEPYELANYTIAGDSLQIHRAIKNTMSQTTLQEGMKFNLSQLKQERERIETQLKQEGYYYFNPQFLIFEADTNQYNNKKFDLFLEIKEEVPPAALVPYKVSRVNIYPNYVVENDSLERDTIRLNNKNFIQEEEFFKPERLSPYVLIDEGDLYDPTTSKYTSRRLASIGAYKFVNIQYDKIDSTSTDSIGFLEANIFLSPLNKRSLQAELQAVAKSNDFAGPLLALTYSNRNLFHGGEILDITGRFGYEWQIAGSTGESLSSTQIGLEADLIFPRMLFPFDINFKNDWFQYSIPKTKISAGVNYLNRTSLYRMISLTGSFGYIWRANRFITHQFDPFSVSYVNPINITEQFQQVLDNNPYLENSFEQQFIVGPRYSFTYNGMVDESDTHQFFLNTNLDLAGNLLGLFSGGGDGDEPKTFLGLRYSQFARIDGDFRYHLKVGSGQKIATRLFAGYGIPYGNSETIPFSRQYFSGGPYSVRAFRIRGLGPGTFNPESSGQNTYFDQAGNVRLEANIEYRFPLFSFFKGAVFADAGNVWHTYGADDVEDDSEYRSEGKFDSDFLQELGAGVGFGVRVEIQSFVIRFDLAAPVRTPWLPEGERWNFEYDQPVFNFGIGYPF